MIRRISLNKLSRRQCVKIQNPPPPPKKNGPLASGGTCAACWWFWLSRPGRGQEAARRLGPQQLARRRVRGHVGERGKTTHVSMIRYFSLIFVGHVVFLWFFSCYILSALIAQFTRYKTSSERHIQGRLVNWGEQTDWRSLKSVSRCQGLKLRITIITLLHPKDMYYAQLYL